MGVFNENLCFRVQISTEMNSFLLQKANSFKMQNITQKRMKKNRNSNPHFLIG